MSIASSFDHSSYLRSNDPRVSTEAREIAQVRSIFDRPTTAQETLDTIRPDVERMVRNEEYLTGSKMLAYRNVGRAIGRSASWVRKLIGRKEVGLQGFALLNIAHAYGVLSAQIEAAAAAERRRAAQLRRHVDADDEGAAGVVASLEGPEGRREGGVR